MIASSVIYRVNMKYQDGRGLFYKSSLEVYWTHGDIVVLPASVEMNKICCQDKGWQLSNWVAGDSISSDKSLAFHLVMAKSIMMH